MASPSLPLDPLFEVLVASLKRNIDAPEAVEGRGVLTYAVRVLPCVCTTTRDMARADPSVAYLIAYETSLWSIGPSGRYCDGLPEAVDPMALCEWYGAQPRSDILKMEDTRKARHVTAQELDTCTNVADLAEDWTHENGINPSIPRNLPTKVRLFAHVLGIRHARLHCNSQYARFFRPCQRKGCQRPAMIPVPEQSSMAYASVARSSGDATAINERRYWQTCHSGSTTGVDERLPRNMAFCSMPCFCAARDEYNEHFDLMARLPAANLCGPPPARRGQKEVTPSRLYRAALGRNASIVRAARFRVDVSASRHYPITLDDARAMHKAFIDALNVDLGVLYAAAVIGELPERLHPNTAMPKSVDWRTQPWLFTTAIQTVRAIYKDSKVHDGIAKGGEPWLGRVKAMSLKVFC